MAEYRHRKTFDLSGLEPAQRDTLQTALNETDSDLGQIRQLTGARAPVTSSSLRRLAFLAADRQESFITEWRGEEPRHGFVRAARGPISVSWLPSDKAPAGGIELAEDLFDDPPAARDVFITEAEALLTRHIFPGEEPLPERKQP